MLTWQHHNRSSEQFNANWTGHYVLHSFIHPSQRSARYCWPIWNLTAEFLQEAFFTNVHCLCGIEKINILASATGDIRWRLSQNHCSREHRSRSRFYTENKNVIETGNVLTWCRFKLLVQFMERRCTTNEWTTQFLTLIDLRYLVPSEDRWFPSALPQTGGVQTGWTGRRPRASKAGGHPKSEITKM